MPKIKTNKAASKRYSFTGTGKIKRTKGNSRHLFANKTKRQRKKGRIQDAYVSESMEKTVKKMLPYGRKFK